MDKHRQIKILKDRRLKWEREKIENSYNMAYLADRALDLIDAEISTLEQLKIILPHD